MRSSGTERVRCLSPRAISRVPKSPGASENRDNQPCRRENVAEEHHPQPHPEYRSRPADAIRRQVCNAIDAELPPQRSQCRGNKGRTHGETPHALERWLGVLIDAGADAFHLSQPKFWESAFPEVDEELNLAGWAKKLTGVTAIAVGLPGDVYDPLRVRAPDPRRWTNCSRGWNAANSTW